MSLFLWKIHRPCVNRFHWNYLFCRMHFHSSNHKVSAGFKHFVIQCQHSSFNRKLYRSVTLTHGASNSEKISGLLQGWFCICWTQKKYHPLKVMLMQNVVNISICQHFVMIYSSHFSSLSKKWMPLLLCIFSGWWTVSCDFFMTVSQFR